MIRILVILIIQDGPPQIAHRHRASAEIPRRAFTGLTVKFRRDFRRAVRKRVRLRVDLGQIPGADLHVAQAIRRRAAGGRIHDRLAALGRVRSLRAEIGAFEKIRAARVPVEEILIIAVEVLGLFRCIVESVADIGGRIVPESRALTVLAVALAAARIPVQRSAVAGEGVDVGVDLAGDDDVVDLVGLRYNVGVEGGETLIDYCVEVGDFAGHWGVFDEGEETGDVVFGDSKGGHVVGFKSRD